jgi:hypothetical protein
MASMAPDRLKALMQSQTSDDAPTGAATPTETDAGPIASPMSTPEPKMGTKEGALVQLSMAFDLIQRAIPELGADSEQGMKAMTAMKLLSGALGPKKPRTDELQPAEIMQLLGSLPQAGNVTPEVAAVMGPGASAQPKQVVPPMQPPGGAGGAPPGGPPGQPQPMAA